jgi:hypothetical protein
MRTTPHEVLAVVSENSMFHVYLVRCSDGTRVEALQKSRGAASDGNREPRAGLAAEDGRDREPEPGLEDGLRATDGVRVTGVERHVIARALSGFRPFLPLQDESDGLHGNLRVGTKVSMDPLRERPVRPL